MIHYNPYSGKRKGEHYVKMTVAERESFVRVKHIVDDIAASNHTHEKFRVLAVRVSTDVLFLLGELNQANEISLLTKAEDEALAKSREANKKFSKVNKENKA